MMLESCSRSSGICVHDALETAFINEPEYAVDCRARSLDPKYFNLGQRKLLEPRVPATIVEPVAIVALRSSLGKEITLSKPPTRLACSGTQRRTAEQARPKGSSSGHLSETENAGL